MKQFLLFTLILPFFATAQLTKKDSLWLPLSGLIGDWKGSGEGVDGAGTYERSYKFTLNKNYIEIKNKTTYPANEKTKTGYLHEDIGYISYDKMRKTFIFRQFHIEGFINQYRLESISSDKKTLTFVSESIENIPTGWRAKEVLMISNNELTEVFYLAEPGKEYEQYTKANLVRK